MHNSTLDIKKKMQLGVGSQKSLKCHMMQNFYLILTKYQVYKKKLL